MGSALRKRLQRYAKPEFAIIVSILSLFVSSLAYCNSVPRELPESDYAVRLQVETESSNPTLSDDAPLAPPPPDGPADSKMYARGWMYAADLRNAGGKTVQIDEVLMAYGQREAPNQIRFVMLSDFFLQPGAVRRLEHSLPWQTVEELRTRFGECMLELQIRYREADGTVSVARRRVGGISRLGIVWNAQGDGIRTDTGG